ncbi:MAG: hypothetical protein ABSC48_04830 [Terracidiphilus sp.]
MARNRRIAGSIHISGEPSADEGGRGAEAVVYHTLRETPWLGNEMAAQMKSAGSMRSLAEFRLIPRLETYPRAVSFAQTAPGKVALLAAFALGSRYFLPDFFSTLPLTFILALITFMPEYRRFILAIAPIVFLVLKTFQDPLLLGASLAVIALGIFLYWCVMRWPKSRFGQRPVLYFLSSFTALILLACAVPPRSLLDLILWALVGALASYLWFICYALADRNSTPARDLTLEMETFHPVWGSTNTPFPKGAAYLRRIEAQNPEQLAIVQLKGLKLLTWAILLAVSQNLWNAFFHGYLRIPMPDQALAMSVQGTPVAWHLRWECQILAFFEIVFTFSIFGHRIISACRMAGFNALRNTYRPLSSTTLAEFFNRFYYYFKELLVDFFFYPAFLRYWKKHRRLRMAFATFAAAFFGNSFYHITRDWPIIRDAGLWKAITSYQVLFFYNAFLAAGLCVSQLRKRKPQPASFFRARLLPAFGVGFFYCMLNVFDADERMYPLLEHIKYLASLFFIHF